LLLAAAREKSALAAAVLISDSKPSTIAVRQHAHTVLKGWYPKDLFILRRYEENGRAPSRENAQVCLDAAMT
jgi:hypothetical protein